MAFINKINQKRSDDFQATIIAEGTILKGNINTSSIFIYGSLEGNIVAKETVTISGKGFVKGKITATTLVVSGLCEGTIDCQIVDILDKGVVDGEVLCDHLVIEKGGFLQGSSKKRNKIVKEKTVEVIENKELKKENKKK
jgi:cytoskeletal protein CcmA (bactofilin family)